MTSRFEIEAIQLSRYNHPEGDHFGRYGSGANDKAMRKHKAKLVRSVFQGTQDKYILDLGADAGGIISTLSKTGKVGVQVDIAYQRLWGNSRFGKGRFVCARAQELPCAENAVDGVCAFDIIEHLIPEDSPIMLQEIYRVLKPGKTVILSSSNTDCVARRIRRLIQPARTSSRNDHANEMAFPALLTLFDRIGFRDIQASGAGMIPGLRKLQWFLPFQFLHEVDNNLGKKHPQFAPEIFITAKK